MSSQKRKFHRVDSLNLLSYFCVDETGETMHQGMGRTLNVSEGGILLETHQPIPTEYTVYLSIGFDEDVTDVRGKITYTKQGENDRAQAGIEFVNPDKNARRIIKGYIEEFERQRG
ncbi:MAG: PilZ domain-containing protein [Desulfosudaceae bacterium]